MTAVKGFEPIIQRDCTILILGSMPGVKSLQVQEYYAHPQNAFWSIIEQVLEIKKDLDFDDRYRQLTGKGIALWDVLHACSRSGSLDSNIDLGTVQVNDFDALFSLHPTIRRVCFNGKVAEKLFKKQVYDYVNSTCDSKYSDITYFALPSTSPAYASMRFEQKLDLWCEALIIDG